MGFFKKEPTMVERGNKKGLSTIVATLLIIMLTLVAVGIIWVVVKNVIQTGAEQVSLGKFSLNLEIKSVVMDSVNLSKINVTVKRNVGDGEISGLKFIIDDGENTEVVEVTNFSLDELQERMFNLSLTDIQNSSKIQKISVAPIFNLESGKAVTGDIKDEYEISEGSESDVISCTPNCVGKQCGSDGCTGTCGTCSTGTCNASFQCSTSCTPNCAGKQCGSDGCTGTCGTCSTGTCNSIGQCVADMIYEENFEGSFLPTGWKTGGNISWNKNTTYIIRGSASAASGRLGTAAYTWTWINYTKNFPYGGFVSFYWNVSSEATNDNLCFCQDKECRATGCTCYYPSGTADAKISSASSGIWNNGFVNWSVTAGNHFFTWCYAKDSGAEYGQDMGIIDNVTFVTNSHAPSTPAWQTGMVSWWRFNGNANDSTGRNNGTVNGATLTSTGCKSGQCYRFDGVNDYVRVLTSNTLDFPVSGTVSLWVNALSSTSSFDMPLWKGGGSAGSIGYDFELGSGTWYTEIANATYTTTCPYSSSPLTGLHMLSFTFDTTTNKLICYVDGINTSSGENISRFGGIDSSYDLYFGTESGMNYDFNGSLDEVMIFNRSLSATEIQQIYSYSYS